MATVAAINELGSCAYNPRGNLWLNDESSFGKKMLVKMGWKKGKGLGKKEDGIKENLKVKFRDTNAGLGYKDDSYANVMNIEYESILKSLSAEYSQDNSKHSSKNNKDFKQKSKIVKRKIRYPKLFYGKDVSKYSEKDIKSIFICSLASIKDEGKGSNNSGLNLKKDSKLCIKEESENQFLKSQETHTSSLSVSDYFSMKRKEKKDNEQRKKYSNKMNQNATEYSNNYEVKEEGDLQSNKTDYTTREMSNFEFSESDNKVEQQQEEDFQFCEPDNMTTSSNGKRHKKKKKKSEISIECESDKNVLPVIENEKSESSPCKKHKKMDKCPVYEGIVCGEKADSEVDQFSVSHKKRKKSHKNDCLNSNSNSDADTVPHKKRKKSHKNDNLNSNSNSDVDTVPHKKRKKSHKNDSLNSNSNSDTDTVPHKKRKKSHTNEDRCTVELLSVTLPKDESLTISNLKGDDSTQDLEEIAVENLSNIDNSSQKKRQKKLKNKINPLEKLKSCLKSKTGEYNVKNVSFSECISYKIIDSDNEYTGFLSECEDEMQTVSKISVANDSPNCEKDTNDCETVANDCNISEPSKTNCSNSCNLSEPSETSCSNSSKTFSEKEAEECVPLTNFPSSKSTYYDSWVQSQKQAFKMTLYKKLLKGIEKHDIFKTTNLLSIKGYGNWGF